MNILKQFDTTSWSILANVVKFCPNFGEKIVLKFCEIWEIGAVQQVRKSCRSQKKLQSEDLLAKTGFDTTLGALRNSII